MRLDRAEDRPIRDAASVGGGVRLRAPCCLGLRDSAGSRFYGQSLTLVTFGPGALSVCPQNSAKFRKNSAKFRKIPRNFRKNPQKSAKIRKNPQNSAKLPQKSAKFRKNPQNSAKLPQKSAKSKNTKGTTC